MGASWVGRSGEGVTAGRLRRMKPKSQYGGVAGVLVVGERSAVTVEAGFVVGGDTVPGCRDVDERLEIVGERAVGSKGWEGFAKGLEIFLELRAVPRFERIEPAAAGEEPVASVSEKEGSVSRNLTF